MNSWPHPSLAEKEAHAFFAFTSIEHEVNRMAKGEYQALLQSMQPLYLLFLFIYSSFLIFFLYRVNNRERMRDFS